MRVLRGLSDPLATVIVEAVVVAGNRITALVKWPRRDDDITVQSSLRFEMAPWAERAVNLVDYG